MGKGHHRPDEGTNLTKEPLPVPATVVIFIFAVFTFFHIAFNVAQLRKMGYD